LIDKGNNIKLCDFGWSAESHVKRQTFCGTVDYMAPEMIKSEPYDFKLDIWCLGVLLYEMLHGFPPYNGQNDKEKCLKIVKNTPLVFGDHISREAMDLICRILRQNPIERFSMEKIFCHGWMKKFESLLKISIKEFIRQQDEMIKATKDPRTQQELVSVNKQGNESFFGDSDNNNYGETASFYGGFLMNSDQFNLEQENKENIQVWTDKNNFKSNSILQGENFDEFLAKTDPLQKRYNPSNERIKASFYDNQVYTNKRKVLHSESQGLEIELKNKIARTKRDYRNLEKFNKSKNLKRGRSAEEKLNDERKNSPNMITKFLIGIGCVSRNKTKF